jgi:hypothetical protein
MRRIGVAQRASRRANTVLHLHSAGGLQMTLCNAGVFCDYTLHRGFPRLRAFGAGV